MNVDLSRTRVGMEVRFEEDNVVKTTVIGNTWLWVKRGVLGCACGVKIGRKVRQKTFVCGLGLARRWIWRTKGIDDEFKILSTILTGNGKLAGAWNMIGAAGSSGLRHSVAKDCGCGCIRADCR